MLESHTPDAGEYITYLRELWPLALLTGGAGIVFGLARSKDSFKLNTWPQFLINTLLRGLTASLFVFVIVPFIPLILSMIPGLESAEAINTHVFQVEVAICLLAAFVGVDTVYFLIKKRLGHYTLNPMSKADMDELHEMLPDEDRKKHAEQCPFNEAGDMVIRHKD